MAGREQDAAECKTDYQLDRDSGAGRRGWHYAVWALKTQMWRNRRRQRDGRKKSESDDVHPRQLTINLKFKIK